MTAASATPAGAGQPGAGAGLDTVHHADIFDLCAQMEPASVDMILCDLPYGTTACSWDTVIPFAPMWAAFKRIVKPRAAIVLTASQPFTSALVMSNPKWFRYEWIWEKSKPVGHLNAALRPMVKHESMLVFSNGTETYQPQGTRPTLEIVGRTNNGAYGECSKTTVQTVTGYPHSLLRFSHDISIGHPTQKPVALFAYLIRTYTQPGALVFDPCVGSGTTALAARQEGRHYIVGDSSAEYVAVTEKRLAVPYTLPMLFADASTEAG